MNFEGLKRRGFSPLRIQVVKGMHKALYRDDLTLSDAMLRIEQLGLEHPEAEQDVKDMLVFLAQTPKDRGIVR